MRKLDTFTIVIISICLLAAALLIYVAWNKLSNKTDDENDRSALYEDIEEDRDGEFYYLDEDEKITPPSTFEEEEETEPQNTSTYDEVNDLQEVDKNGDPISDNETPPMPSSYSTTGEYLVLAGSFRIMANAESHVRTIRNKGYNNANVERFDKGTYAVVLVDRFTSLSSAQDLVGRLRGDGVEAYVKKN